MKTVLAVLLLAMMTACGGGNASKDVRHFVCEGIVPIAGGTLQLFHHAWVYPDGGVMVTCSVHAPSFQSGDTFLFLRPQDPTIKKSTCVVTADVTDPASGGLFIFEMNDARSASNITYYDGSPTRVGALACSEATGASSALPDRLEQYVPLEYRAQ